MSISPNMQNLQFSIFLCRFEGITQICLCNMQRFKMIIFRCKKHDIFLIFAQNVDFRYNLCFRAKIRKNEYPCIPQFYYIKGGRHVILMERVSYSCVLIFQQTFSAHILFYMV